MANGDDLHKELDKLEITHILPQIKLMDSNLPVQLNPFFENSLNKTLLNDAATLKLFPSSSSNRTAIPYCRRCRFRRLSESVLDDLKNSSPNDVSDSVKCTRTPPSGSLKKSLKKITLSSGSGNRKVVLREPVLKALQTCLHPHGNVRRKLLSSAVLPKSTAGSDGSLSTKGMSDFRDLIDECYNLLSEDVDFSGRLNKLCISNHNSKNFTTMQTPNMQSSNKLHNKKPSLNTDTLSLPSPEIISLNEEQSNSNAMSLLHPPPLGSNVSSINLQQRVLSNLSLEQVSNPARCNTTCSQQAGNSAAATCDDVTIDELASYFDTFVHIPKKMSTMAEMMYI